MECALYPEGVAWQPVKMNRTIVDKKMVIYLFLQVNNTTSIVLIDCV